LTHMKNMITNAAGALGAWTLTRRVTRHVPRIFMFHRFSSKPSDGTTDADELIRFIERVRAVCELVTVSDLASRLEDPRPMGRPLAAITVDDGYADFHTVALPILAERGVPATLYATAGFVDGRCWLWWDALRHLLEVHPGGTLELELDGQVVAWQLGDAASRQNAWERIADTLVSRNAERATVLSALEAAAGQRVPTRPTLEYAPMSWAQLAEAEAAGIEIGGHTMTHAFLPGLDHDGLRQELNAAKALMEQHLTRPLVTFAYPNGDPIRLHALGGRCRTRSRLLGGRSGASAPVSRGGPVPAGALVRTLGRATPGSHPERGQRPEAGPTSGNHAMTSAGDPEVSVIIATYNMGQHVGQAITSVLAQQGHELEVIVVDDGSTDTTPRALEEFADEPRVRVLTQQNQGQPKAKNAGLRAARGRYIAFCDADDYWLPNKLDRQIPLLEQNAAVGVVYSTIVRLEPDGCLRPQASRPLLRSNVLQEMFVRNIVPFGTALVRRECFDQVGGFDESIPMGIDWDLWLRIATRWEFDVVAEPTYVYRIWEGQMSHNWRGRYDCALRIMERFLVTHPGLVSKEVIATAYADTYTNLARAHFGHRGFGASLPYLKRALTHRPLFWPAWRFLLEASLRGIRLAERS
jgi:glycosyltransferase involved in cell wall biosynthesis/peptidoglycan/xylan/chitin deacetylase (PgdA/CDA1 family)